MALPAELQEQIARMEERVRLVPTDIAPPPAEVREQVRLWQEHVHEAAEAIRWADNAIEQLTTVPEGSQAERDQALAKVRALRVQAFDLMRRLNPDQAWFWTEEWQAGERDVDREIAAGHLVRGTPEEFDAALDALDAEST